MENRLSDGAIAANASNPFSGRPNEGMTASMLGWFGLFHHWDFIYSDTVEGKPDWLTNDRHPLNTRTLYYRWKRVDQLIGVRFQTKRGGNVAYIMLDVDRHSQYHPYQHEPEFRRLLAALEAVGLCRYIIVRSSPSEGLHIYYPLAERVGCRLLANTIQRTLQQTGFVIEQGQLEVFPNVRSSSKVLYNGHRSLVQKSLESQVSLVSP